MAAGAARGEEAQPYLDPAELAVLMTCSAGFRDMFSQPEEFCQIEIVKLQPARCAEAGGE